MAEEAMEAPAPFHSWLSELRHGDASIEWSEELAELLLAVQTTGKKGKLLITIEVASQGRSVIVTDKLELKAPKPDPEASVWWVDASGSLVRNDPGQLRLPIEENRLASVHDFEVDEETGEIRR